MPLIEAQPDALSKVYADSVYDLAARDGGPEGAEGILGELEDILELARENPLFNEFLASRVLPSHKRDGALDNIFTGRVSDLTVRFLRLLNRKNRLSHLPAITASLAQKVSTALGRVEVDLHTATALEGEELESVREQIQATLGKNVVLHTYIEPAMLGGIKLRIGDRLIDDSLSTQLRRVQARLHDQGAAEVRANASRIIDNA